MPIAAELRQIITVRDKRRCAYCLTSELNCGLRMHIDHIIPEAAGGATIAENLCLACFSCNKWDETDTLILGKTPSGRATVDALQMNNETVVLARRRWVSAGWHPPEDHD